MQTIVNRFADICRTLHRLKSKEVTAVYTTYQERLNITNPDVTIPRLTDPTEPYIKLFGELLHPKSMLPIDINGTTIQYKDEDGNTRNFSDLSSGEKEVVILTFDVMAQNPSDCIILIDEPEVHLHPELAFRLVRVLRSIGERNQFFLFTHSADIIGNALDTGIHFIRPRSRVASGNQVVHVSEENLGGLRDLPNLRETIGVISVGKKLLFVEGENSSIDRTVFAALAKSTKKDLSIIPSSGCSNVSNMSLICDTLSRGIFGVEFFMIRDRDGLTDTQIQEFVRQSNGKLLILPYYHIENTFLVPAALHTIAKAILLSKAPSLSEIETRLVEYARKQIPQTAALYVKREIYFEAGNFDVSPSVPIDQNSSVDQIVNSINQRAEVLLARYQQDFNRAKIESRVQFWTSRLQNALANGWSSEARSIFIGKRLLNEIRGTIFGSKSISLPEHILASTDEQCRNCYAELTSMIGSI